MDSKVYSSPLARATVGVHLDTTTFLGSDRSNANATYGYVEHKKPRWTQQVREYEDAAALERFGIDPTKPVPLGVTVTSDPYGYPIDGYTTGYTIKLPPPADPVAAQRTPKSFNLPQVVSRGSGDETMAPPPLPANEIVVGPGQDPVDAMEWTYEADSGMQKTAQLIKTGKELEDLIQRSGLDPATAAQTLLMHRQRRPVTGVVSPNGNNIVMGSPATPQA